MTQQRWTVEELEDAYMRWAYECEKNLTDTAELTGIPLRTLQYHKAKDNWDERYSAETSEIAGLAFTYGLNELRLGISAAALALVRDASSSTLQHSERLASQKLLFSLMLSSPTSESPATSHLSLIDARSIHLPPNSSDANVISARAIEANLAVANEAQSKRRTSR
jgi:hypothetical protein